MKFSNFVRMHWAALRALLVLTVLTGLAYPLLIWLVAQIPGLHDKAEGSILTANGKPVGSRLIGQLFTDKDGNALPKYFQSRPSAAGTGYDPLSSSASNLGPESIVDTPADPSQMTGGKSASDAGFKPSLLTQVCTRSSAIGQLEGVDGSRPFCTGGGVGAVLSVIGPRDAGGNVAHPTRVVSVNEPCQSTQAPFLSIYEGVRVECAKYGEDYTIGQIVPVRGAAPEQPAVPADAVTASGSGLDPNISPAYADIQVARVAKARHVSPEQIRAVLARFRSGRDLGFFGEPTVNVLELNLQLDRQYPVSG
ncbi:K+-transporting ATPase subunit C [Mycobacterium paraense]|jgi:K+-transporting ATPase ATPase C chain|uniref:Potassium-transporting ATPase KdpC subunit n=1 Tax=Mycobacterium paraense TaxID=767916 RepID=A0ABX3VP93_9MYCO|nr:potassium-transporting ATPase subunit C [Mycobacterium paraense]MCV7443670.1 potassium-transporting ATPase subunit C [Mycobacterium paraense]ORW31930.1 K+-transporting ATPase subunit C [Mycobacterium paraense]ORW39458.1 K+-transporting ATPase subunit C [Mycobacterium paraense]ORW47433.1 K+-transporting ATPase subunit C [Mycobacterium paraense]